MFTFLVGAWRFQPPRNVSPTGFPHDDITAALPMPQKQLKPFMVNGSDQVTLESLENERRL